MPNLKANNPPLNSLGKSLKYSVVTTFINFDVEKHRPNIIIVNGALAIRLKGNLYTKM